LKAEASVAARDVLAQARFFTGLDRAQLDRIAALGQTRSFQADTRIYTVGDAVDHFYVLADGMVRFTLGLSKRDTAAGDIIHRGDVFGWAALVEGHRQRIATAYCLTACEVVALDGTALTRLMETDARIGFAVMKKLAVLLTSELVALAAG
jgi:toluene monooxygenase system ferredoxin subunit